MSRKICITAMVNFSNNEESVNIIIYFLLLLKRHLKINSNVLHSSDSGLNGAIGKSGRGQRTWTRTTDVDKSGHSQVVVDKSRWIHVVLHSTVPTLNVIAL